jgi:hypothetical protein
MLISQVFLRAAVAGAAAALFMADPARANIVFDFSGVCSIGCSGTATGVLTLANSYTFGADITAADFISLDYSSSSYSFDIASVDSPILAGGLNADGSLNSFGALEILAPTDFPTFGAFNGFFNVANEAETFNLGSAYTFTLVSGAVPEPSTWTMMVLGFAGLGYAGYRKARQAAFASA